MYYIIYKITNQLNGKFYIGKHKTKDLNDGYMGSGKLIKAAIKKHGIESFEKEILYVFDTEAEMNEAEASLVVVGESSYNLCPGGQGGFGYINKNGLNAGIRFSDVEQKKRAGSIGGTKRIPFLREMSVLATEARLRLYPEGTFKNKKHSDESKLKIKKSSIGKHSGRKNSQYGRPRSEETKAKLRATWAAKKMKLQINTVLPL